MAIQEGAYHSSLIAEVLPELLNNADRSRLGLGSSQVGEGACPGRAVRVVPPPGLPPPAAPVFSGSVLGAGQPRI